MASNERYIQFPLLLIRELFTDKRAVIDNIFNYGIYKYSTKLNFKVYDVARQLIYAYYRKRSDLSKDLLMAIENYIDEEKIDIDEDYNGFVGTNNFVAETEIQQILELFEGDKDFKDMAIEYYQIHTSLYSLNLIDKYPNNTLKQGKKIDSTIPDREPFPMISTSLLFDFRDNNKTEFDIAQFAAYIAVRSILGKKSYCRTNKQMIVSRMFGYASNKQMQGTLKPAIKDLFNKYSNRYHIDKVLQQLELNWNVITYSSNMRGLLIGIKNKTSIDALALIAENRKLKNKISKLKDAKREAKEKALQHLNKGQQLNKENDIF